MANIIERSYTSPSLNRSSSTFASVISWSHITQNKWEYFTKVLALVWLTIISASIILISIVWNSDKEPWNSSFDNLKVTNQQVYYIILIIFQCTILSICIVFLLQYFILPALLPTIYSYQYKTRIPGVKHKKRSADQPHRPLLTPTDENETKYENQNNKMKMNKIMRSRDKTITRNNNKYDRCSLCCQYTFTSKWTLYNWMSIPVVLYHLFHVIVIVNSFSCHQTKTAQTDSVILIIYHIFRALTDIMPGLCLIMYWKAKEIYDPMESSVKKYEKQILSKEIKALQVVSRSADISNVNLNINRRMSTTSTEQNANRFQYRQNTKTLAAVHSVLSKCTIKAWLLFAISFSLYNFLFWPAVNAQLFQEFLDDYQCNYNHSSSENMYNDIYFVLQMCLLRPFNGMILTYTIFLTLPIDRHYSSQLSGFKSILSPTIFAIIVLFEMAELRFFQHDTVHCLMAAFMTLIYVMTSVWCLTLLCSLMALQSSADRQRNRFHGYRQPLSVIILLEGVFVLILYVLCFGFILRNEENEDQNNAYNLFAYAREASILLFNIVQIFMLFPLRIIGLEPGLTKDYFLNPAKSKYITTFKWIVLLNFLTFIYSFIFIANNYSDMIWGGFEWNTDNNYQNSHNAIYVLSYTFTFVMPYYSIWAISQYDNWVNLNADNLNLEYPESEFSINNAPDITSHDKGQASLSNDIVLSNHEIKEQIININNRIRIKSETEMSVSSTQRIGNSFHVKGTEDYMKRSEPKTIKRNKLKKRQRRHRPKSVGGKPLDINAAFYNQNNNPLNMAHTPQSIPENYNQTMHLFDPKNIPPFPDDDIAHNDANKT